MTTPQQLTREQMEALIAERFPSMSPETREACCTGSLLKLSDGRQFVVPTALEEQKATHFIKASIARIGDQWIQ